MTLLNLVKMQLLDQNKTLSHLSFYTLGVGMSQHQQHSKCNHLSSVINKQYTSSTSSNTCQMFDQKENYTLHDAYLTPPTNPGTKPCLIIRSRMKTTFDHQTKNDTLDDAILVKCLIK